MTFSPGSKPGTWNATGSPQKEPPAAHPGPLGVPVSALPNVSVVSELDGVVGINGASVKEYVPDSRPILKHYLLVKMEDSRHLLMSPLSSGGFQRRVFLEEDFREWGRSIGVSEVDIKTDLAICNAATQRGWVVYICHGYTPLPASSRSEEAE